MATVLLSAAGAAIGGSIGGTVAGLSAVAIGRFVGATVGQVIDQSLMGRGSQVIEQGRVDRFRVTGAAEGASVAQLYGRMRLGGQVMWASQFQEHVETSGGGKGRPSQPETRSYSYSVSLAVALCEGEIASVGRVWADGEEVAVDTLNMTFYPGSPDQQPDPVMEAVEGAGQVPAYRGTAYVVFENLSLTPFGSRVPQFTFEVIRPEDPREEGHEFEMARGLKAVALVPGTGEYSLATTPVFYSDGDLESRNANVNSVSNRTDFTQSMEALYEEVPNVQAASLIVCWFGDDLRAGECLIEPKVEQHQLDGENMPWSVSGLGRASAKLVPIDEGRPVYGGTPTDQAVVEAIRAMNAAGKAVMFYPFILMDQMVGSGLPDPYAESGEQAHLPWRGRITTSKAAGLAGSPDGTAGARSEVEAFFGSARAADFAVGDGEVTYSGPQEWRFRRFILHYAALCAAAGGVEAFCIGSEMRGLTWIRDDVGFPSVDQLRALAAECRAILGPDVKISYASDWSEYFGFQPSDGSGDRLFHLDPLWADPVIDFVGIDNYMPLSDWRQGQAHLDAQDWPSIYDVDYLRSNIEGGEGYDWFYHSVDARAAQIRTPIADGAFEELWIYRYKDIRNWWSNAHHDRVNGERAAEPTAWEPGMKPIWFTEFGCAALDRGTNQPNKFIDPKSSESRLPRYSTGARDGLIQKQYYRAMLSYWNDPTNNPEAEAYAGRMLDMSRAYAWAWDTRPYPFFPNLDELWSDGSNYARGHWLTGRVSSRTLASVVAEICDRAGVVSYDVSQLYGYVRGYVAGDVGEARAALEPLMLRFGFDGIERDGTLVFRMRDGLNPALVSEEMVAVDDEIEALFERTREADAVIAGRVRLRFVEADADFDIVAEEGLLPDEATHAVATSELAMALTKGEGRGITERWLAEARVARDAARFALPPSRLEVGAGDVVALPNAPGERRDLYRVDRVEQGPHQVIEAVRIEPSIYNQVDLQEVPASRRAVPGPVPVNAFFMDLPLILGTEAEAVPHVAASADPWPGSVAVYRSQSGEDFRLDTLVNGRAVIGVTQNPLFPACMGRPDRGDGLDVVLQSGALESVTDTALAAGANLMAIGDGTPGGWELFQVRDVELIAPQTYRLRHRLRGQAGTEALAAEFWPAGSYVVLMNGLPLQLDNTVTWRFVSQTLRVGPAAQPLDAAAYRQVTHTFEGLSLRPYAPVHVRADVDAGGVEVSWIRRTRVEGDAWDLADVPLGESRELYQVSVLFGGVVVREVQVAEPGWVYSAADMAADGVAGGFAVRVAQVSERFGPGPAGVVSVAA